MKRIFTKKSVAMLVSLALLACVAVGSTIAWITAKTNAVTNEFTPGSVTTQVSEVISGKAKEDVRIKNTGNVPAYIRAAVVVTWQNSAGEIYGKQPVAGVDYSMTIETGKQPDYGNGEWVERDGFYYWNKPVAPNGGYTGILIESCTAEDTAPDGYFLNVEILGSGIQSDGVDSANQKAVVEAWGVDPSGLTNVVQGGG